MGDVGRCIYENMEILRMKDAYTFYVCVKDYYITGRANPVPAQLAFAKFLSKIMEKI